MSIELIKFNPYAATHRACDVTREMMRGQALPLQFPVPYDPMTDDVHRPLFSFYREIGLGPAWETLGQHHLADARNAAQAVRQFTDLLGSVQREVEEADATLCRIFGDQLVSRVNYRTGEHLSSDYMRTTATYVAKAFEHMNGIGATDVDLDAAGVIALLSDDDLDVPANADQFGARTHRRIHRKAMEEWEWRKVAAGLGGLVTGGWVPGMPSMRPRLTAELPLQTGVRVHEDVAISREAILALPWTGDTTGHVPLTLLTTKGGRIRDVALPRLLLGGLRHYALTEWVEADEARRDRMGSAYWEHDKLFVHGLDARGHSGNPIGTSTVQSDFRRAVIAAGLVRKMEVRLPNGELLVFEVPLYSVHSLRHTFAIWMYYARKHILKIDSEPWKYISARLGHADLGVTLKTYLDLGRMLEPQVGSILRGVFLAALDWEDRG